MKYLKKEMVKKVIELARVCPLRKEYTPKEIALGMKGHLPIEPEVQAFNLYLKEIGTKATAELTALMWLGRDSLKVAEEWTNFVEEAMGPGMGDIFSVPKHRLGQYLRTGMERLARAGKRQKQLAQPGRIIVAKNQAPPVPQVAAVPQASPAKGVETADPERESRRRELAGKYVLQSFRERYGADGPAQLGRLMVAAGMLESTEERALFALEPAHNHDSLTDILDISRSR